MDKKLKRHAFLIYFVLVSASSVLFSIELEPWIEINGWSEFAVSESTWIFYIANDGSDRNSKVYPSMNKSIGRDPLMPSSKIAPYKTYAKAREDYDELVLKRGYHPAWFLFKRGDQFTARLIPTSGNGPNEISLIGAYGSYGPLPVIMPEMFDDDTTGWDDRRNVIDVYARRGYNCTNTVITSLDFYSADRDPKNRAPEHIYSNGIAILALGTDDDKGVVENILIEGCRFRFFNNNGIQAIQEGTACNIIFNRCSFTDNYAYSKRDGHSQGLFASNINGLFLYDNIFIHNGWMNRAGDVNRIGTATMFNHNTYIEDCHDVVLIGNISLQPSSIHHKFTANKGPGSSTGIVIRDNLMVDGEVGISIGGNEEGPSRFADIILEDNVIMGVGLSKPTNRNFAWGLEIKDWDEGRIENNIIANFADTDSDMNIGVCISDSFRQVLFSGNHIYRIWGETFKIGEFFPPRINLTIRDNFMECNDEKYKWLKLLNIESEEGIDFAENIYFSLESKKHPFRLGENWGMTFDDWKSLTGDSSSFQNPSYNDPGRTVDKYNAEEAGGEESFEAFILGCRSQNRFDWNTIYTSEKINGWISQGFNNQ